VLGLSLPANDVLSGTPTNAGTLSFILAVADTTATNPITFYRALLNPQTMKQQVL
jgi:hypothetical protein